MLLAEGAHTESGRLLAGWQITERLVAAGAVARPLTMPPRYEVIGIEGIGEVRPGDDVARIVVEAAARAAHAAGRRRRARAEPEDRVEIRGPAAPPERDHASRSWPRPSPPSWGAIPVSSRSSCASRAASCAWTAACW